MKQFLLFSLLFLLTACSSSGNVPEANFNLNENFPPEVKEEYPIFYLGYGSNMDTETMNRRCGPENFIDLGKVMLPDYEFYFYGRGYANIRPKENKYVEGVLYKINESCLDSLDVAEGYPNVYQRQEVSLDYKNDIIKAEVYLVIGDNSYSKPSNSYYDTVINGAKEHNLSSAYIKYITLMSGW